MQGLQGDKVKLPVVERAVNFSGAAASEKIHDLEPVGKFFSELKAETTVPICF
jgi:hypothetical protein